MGEGGMNEAKGEGATAKSGSSLAEGGTKELQGGVTGAEKKMKAMAIDVSVPTNPKKWIQDESGR